MKIYLAGASVERDVIRGYRDRLIAAGHEIARDWIADVDANVAAGKTDRDLTRTEMSILCERDLKGVRTAEVFWLIVPKVPKISIGCWVEFGVAISSGDILVVASGDIEASIFLRAADWKFYGDGSMDPHELAFESICRVAKKSVVA